MENNNFKMIVIIFCITIILIISGMVIFYENKIEKFEDSIQKTNQYKDSVEFKNDSLLIRCKSYDNIFEKQQIKLDAVKELSGYIDSTQRRQLRSEIMYRSLLDIEKIK